MITFDGGPARFNFRVVGVALDRERGRALLHRAEHDDFWSLPGGRAELLEPAEATLRREMREELGVEVAVERLDAGDGRVDQLGRGHLPAADEVGLRGGVELGGLRHARTLSPVPLRCRGTSRV